MTKQASRLRAVALALAAAASMIALASQVSRNGEPGWLTGLDRALVNHGAPLAWWLTWTCYPIVLAPIGVALLISAWRVPEWRGRILFSLAILLLCWLSCDQLQHLFHRPRRLDWVLHHESSFSYPSSHATIALGFYGLWAWMLAESNVRARVWLVPLLVLLVLAIYWARLALGAHYFTDLAGGSLLAIALVSAGVAVAPIKVIGFSRDRA